MSNSHIQAMNDVSQLNNEAVRHMHSQRFQHAISKLTQAMRACREILSDLAGEDDAGEVPACRAKSKLINMDDLMKTGKDQLSATTESVTHNDEYGNTRESMGHCCRQYDLSPSKPNDQYVYSKAIEVPELVFDDHLLQSDSYMVANICTVLSCVATFNLALVHHFMAYQSDERCRQSQGPSKCCLLKAARLYEICVVLQDDEACNVSLFDLAVANNLGIVLGEIGRPEKAKKLFQFSLSALMLLLNRPRLATGGHGMQKVDIDGFLSNASQTIYQTEAAAAA